ncbi:MAG: DUF4386 family protein [Nocardioides sp.]
MAAQDPAGSIPFRGPILVIGPVVTVVARLISVPWNDDGRRGANEVVGRFAEHPGRADAGAALVMAGGVLLVLTVLALSLVLARAKPRTAAVSGVLMLCGCASIIALGTMSATTGQMVRHAPVDVAVDVVSHLTVDSYAINVLTLLGALGWLVLGVGLFRSRQLQRPTAVLVAFGGFTTTFTAAGPILVLVVGTAALLLAGTALAAVHLTRGDNHPQTTTPETPRTVGLV